MTRALTAATLALLAARDGSWCFHTPQTRCAKTMTSSHPAALNISARSWIWRKTTVSWVRHSTFRSTCLLRQVKYGSFQAAHYISISFFFCSASDQPICGNSIVEEGEECDIGHNDTDLCCYSAKETVGVQCRLKPGKVCRYLLLKLSGQIIHYHLENVIYMSCGLLIHLYLIIFLHFAMLWPQTFMKLKGN